MNVEIRACRDAEELAAYGKIVAYVFANNDTSDVDTELGSTQPDWTTCAFVDGSMAATMGVFPFTVRLNGEPVRMGGVTAVGTLPSYRRQGLLRQIMKQGLETMRERGQAYAILWASMAAIYQRFGYGSATTRVDYKFDPRTAQLRDNRPTSGSVSLMTSEDAFPIIKQLYIQDATPRNMALHRSTVIWRVDTLRPRHKGDAMYTVVYRNEEGEPRGYLVYGTHEATERSSPGPDQTLTVKDFVALDMEGYRALWQYILKHDLVGTVRIWACIAEDDPAPDLLLEPRMLQRSTMDGIWMRVVDVEAAVPQRPYGSRGELTFRIEQDDLCPWNNGSFLMETDGKTTAIRRTDRKPNLTMSINSLASLLAGHRSATRLARAGLISAIREPALDTADAIFRTNYLPHLPNNF
jgi:predicted acetyltransferase